MQITLKMHECSFNFFSESPLVISNTSSVCIPSNLIFKKGFLSFFLWGTGVGGAVTEYLDQEKMRNAFSKLLQHIYVSKLMIKEKKSNEGLCKGTEQSGGNKRGD